MAGKGHGDRVRERSVVMLLALQAGDLSRDELITRVVAELGNDAYRDSPVDTFSRDKAYLASLGFTIHYSRKTNTYHLDPHNPLLRLPLSPEDGQLLALIRQAFQQTPYADAVNDLVARLVDHLSPDAQAAAQRDPLLTIVLSTADDLSPQQTAFHLVQQAIQRGQALEFQYRSSRAQTLKRHVVQPYDSLEFRDGHFYFTGHSLLTGYDYEFRLDRIEPGAAHILPQKLAERRPKPQPLTLRYHLAARIASYGASRRFPGHQEERQPNGDVIVTAEIDVRSLFWASKTLLKYGENCEVLEPKELREEMTRVAQAMVEVYLSPLEEDLQEPGGNLR